MPIPNQKQRSVELHDFAMTPSADTPRSQFNLSHGRKVPFSFSKLIPILCEFVLPGDTWNCRITTAARTATPIVPVQDNWHLNFFSFFCPMRLVWSNSEKFFGEQDNPGDSIAYTIPTVLLAGATATTSSLYDYFGLPLGASLAAAMPINALPFRAYNRIYNEWFRDENLQSSIYSPTNDGPDVANNYVLQNRGKRFDYFTQALPWPQKGNTAITIPLGTSAPVIGVAGQGIGFLDGGATAKNIQTTSASTAIALSATSSGTGPLRLTTVAANSGIVADLTAASGATINSLRTSIALQQYLERDARGGTRYNEFVYTHYRVRTADARLDRPEFIGSGYAPINTVPIAQTSATGLTGATTPIGTLAATGYVGEGRAGFTYSATEHGYIITLCCATADLTYSQGLRRMWTMSTRYDVPVPVLAGLGEQSLLNQEIYAAGVPAQDTAVFGYVPRFDEFRFIPSQVVGLYRPAAAGNIAYWHSSAQFSALPTLGNTFITDSAETVLQRNFAAGAATANQQVLADFYFDIKCARALPLYGVPGLTRL